MTNTLVTHRANLSLRGRGFLEGPFRLAGAVQLLSPVRLFATPWAVPCQASLSITDSRSLLKLMSVESVMPSNHLILCRPLLPCLHSFPPSGSFLISQFFASGGQSIGASASASVLPMNTHSTDHKGYQTSVSVFLPHSKCSSAEVW